MTLINSAEGEKCLQLLNNHTSLHVGSNLCWTCSKEELHSLGSCSGVFEDCPPLGACHFILYSFSKSKPNPWARRSRCTQPPSSVLPKLFSSCKLLQLGNGVLGLLSHDHSQLGEEQAFWEMRYDPRAFLRYVAWLLEKHPFLIAWIHLEIQAPEQLCK